MMQDVSGKITRVEDMEVYRLSLELAFEVERETRRFGQDFRWLREQLLKSSESVPTNMTEGFYAQYSTEYLQSLYRSRREGRETQNHLTYAEGVRQLPKETAQRLLCGYENVLHQIANLISSIERKIAMSGKGKPSAFILRESGDEYHIDLEPSTMNHQPSSIIHEPSGGLQ